MAVTYWPLAEYTLVCTCGELEMAMVVGYTVKVGETPPNKRHTGSASTNDLNCIQPIEGAALMNRNCCPSVEVAKQSKMAVSTAMTERECSMIFL